MITVITYTQSLHIDYPHFRDHTASTKIGIVRSREHVAETDVQTGCSLHRRLWPVIHIPCWRFPGHTKLTWFYEFVTPFRSWQFSNVSVEISLLCNDHKMFKSYVYQVIKISSCDTQSSLHPNKIMLLFCLLALLDQQFGQALQPLDIVLLRYVRTKGNDKLTGSNLIWYHYLVMYRPKHTVTYDSAIQERVYLVVSVFVPPWRDESDKLILMRKHMSPVIRKPVYAICEQQRRRSACA